MKVIRLISAFCFSSVLLIGGYGAFWWTTANRVEKEVVSALQAVFGEGVTYSTVYRHNDPFSIRLTLHDLALKNRRDDMEVMYRVGDADLQANLGSQIKFTMTLPYKQELVVSTPLREKRYELHVNGGKLRYFNDGADVLFSANDVAMHTEGGQKEEAVATSGNVYVGLSRTTRQASVSAKHVDMGGVVEGSPVFDSFVLALDLANAPQASVLPFIAPVLVGDEAALKEQVARYGRRMAQNGEHGIQVNNFRMEVGDYWMTLSGRVGVERDMWPTGQMDMTVSSVPRLVAYLEGQGAVKNIDTTQNKLMRQLLRGEEESRSLRVDVERGDVRVNATPVGLMVPLNEVFNLPDVR